jgi:integrase
VPSASITVRKTKGGGRRYAVRFRLGGRAYPVERGGSFATMREARVRRDLIAGELAAGRNPQHILRRPVHVDMRDVSAWLKAWKETRVDVAQATLTAYDIHSPRIERTFGTRDSQTIAWNEIQEWIGANADLKPSSLARYLMTFRQVLDYAGVEPNPARDKRVKPPRVEHEEIEPPTSEQVEPIIAHSPPRWKLALRTLEQTGARVGELSKLEWRDVDVVGSQFRLRGGTTKTRRARFAKLPTWLMEQICQACPPDDRVAERRVFPGFTPNGAKAAMRRACKGAGIPYFSPHDLRHRYASVKIAEGIPVTEVRRN